MIHQLRSIYHLQRRYISVLPTTNSPITPRLDFFNTVNAGGNGQIPTYRVLDPSGRLVEGAQEPELDEALAVKIYTHMNLLPTLDNVLYNVQRQGKISFYMTAHGEEATVIGAAAGLEADDEVLGQYREAGVLLWRGFGIDSIMAQCFGNADDTSSMGRQMPVHFSSPAHHFHTISSPLATQIPQAAGIGYALKRARAPRIATCFFGEGAASEGDFHAGLLLASTLRTPTLFLARNNGFAISTPSAEQYAGDGIAARGPGYGVETLRVDGNDVLAVLNAVREGRRRALEDGGKTVLIEAMTYRVGHHSTSDDSYAYRERQEVEKKRRGEDPIGRVRAWIESKGWWDKDKEGRMKAQLKEDVMTSFKKAERREKMALGKGLFGTLGGKDGIYGGEEPWNLREQRSELGRLLGKYGTWETWKHELEKYEGKGTDMKE